MSGLSGFITATSRTPAEVAVDNIDYNNATNPFLNERRFEIQVHKDGNRKNFRAPTFDVVEMLLLSLARADDPNRPDMILVADGRDTCVFILRLEKRWYGYATTLRRGVALGEKAVA